MSQQTQLKVEENSIATMTSIVVKKVDKKYKKNVATQKILLRHNEELKTENGREMRQAKTSLSQQRFQCYNKKFSKRHLHSLL